jgi:chromate transport protein ChrA
VTTEPPEQDLKALWRTQRTETLTMSVEAIRAKSNRFEGRVRRRNLREYLASAVVVIAFAAIGWSSIGWMVKLGSALVIIGTLYIVWRLHRDGATRRAPPEGSAQTVLDFHRAQLTRQRDLLSSVWFWYLGPLVPGVVLITLGRWFQDHAPHRPVATDHLIIGLVSVIVALVFAAVWLVNALGAAKLQRQIDELEGLRGG